MLRNLLLSLFEVEPSHFVYSVDNTRGTKGKCCPTKIREMPACSGSTAELQCTPADRIGLILARTALRWPLLSQR